MRWTKTAVLATLTAFARHLSPGGTVVIEFLHGPALVRSAAPLRIRRFALSGAGDELVRISQTRLDEARNVMEVEFELLELRCRRHVRAVARVTGESVLRAGGDAGSRRARWPRPAAPPSGLQDDGAIDESTFHVLAVAGIR